MDARPDKEEMEEAIENFLGRLEKQEQRGFKDLKTLLSELPCPQPAAGRSLSVSDSQRPWKLASSPKQTKTWWICSRRQNYDCTVMHKIIGTQIKKDIPSYPIIDWVYLSIYVVLAGGLLMNSKI